MKKAILLGSNGPADVSPLRYAVEDVRQLGTCLAGPRCGFDVVTAPNGLDAHQVRTFIEQTTSQCGPSDTLICYFSGNGDVDQGSLFLLWDNTKADQLLSSAIPADDVLRAMRFCRAQN